MAIMPPPPLHAFLENHATHCTTQVPQFYSFYLTPLSKTPHISQLLSASINEHPIQINSGIVSGFHRAL